MGIKHGVTYAHGLTILVLASTLAVSLGIGNSNRTIVGGSQGWSFGNNYAGWVCQNGPFFLNDTLVFKYAPPSNTTFPHSVYLLPNYKSFNKCDLRKGQLVGSTTQGGRGGFRFLLKNQQPYYFACGERNGFHCRSGLMKFFVIPISKHA